MVHGSWYMVHGSSFLNVLKETMFECNSCGDIEEANFYSRRRTMCKACFNAERREKRQAQERSQTQVNLTVKNVRQHNRQLREDTYMKEEDEDKQSVHSKLSQIEEEQILTKNGLEGLRRGLVAFSQEMHRFRTEMSQFRAEMAYFKDEMKQSMIRSFAEREEEFQLEISTTPIDPLWNQIGSRALSSPQEIKRELVYAEYYVSLLKKQLQK
jgi:hypothetical protein